jgi:hypothetical protein
MYKYYNILSSSNSWHSGIHKLGQSEFGQNILGQLSGIRLNWDQIDTLRYSRAISGYFHLIFEGSSRSCRAHERL